MEARPKQIGLALGGGAALGAAHIGVLRYLEEHNYQITHIAGTSIGSLVGGAYASGVPIVELTKFARRARWTKITRLAIPRLSLFSNDKLKDSIKRLVGDQNFSDTRIPFSAVAASLETGQEVILKKGPLVDGILASCAIPGIFEPVDINGQMLCDGGIVNIVPDDIVLRMGAKTVVAVDLTTRLMGDERPDSIFGVIYKTQNILIKRTLAYDDQTIVIAPPITGFSAADFNNYRTLIRLGYKTAEEVLGRYWS